MCSYFVSCGIQWFAEKLARENNSLSRHDQDRHLVVKMLCRYYEIVENDAMFHPESSIKELNLLENVGVQVMLHPCVMNSGVNGL